MQANIFLLVVYSLYADQYKLFKKPKKTRRFNCFGYFLFAIEFILKILKKLGQEDMLCTEEKILMAFLALE